MTGPESPPPAVTLVFITHAEELERSTPRILRLAEAGRVDVMMVNYCFQPFMGWGRYFEFQEGWTDEGFAALLQPFKDRGFTNVLYVDVTESASGVSGAWADSAAWRDPRGVLDVMTLNPDRSWYRHLKAGMLGLARRFPETVDGFAVDRLDRCANAQEDFWAARLLDEVRAEAGRPIVYVMNSLRSDQVELASRAFMVGTDGVPPGSADAWLSKYRLLAEHTETGSFYLAPLLDDADPEASGAGYAAILPRHGVILVDDRPQYLSVVDRLLSLGSGR